MKRGMAMMMTMKGRKNISVTTSPPTSLPHLALRAATSTDRFPDPAARKFSATARASMLTHREELEILDAMFASGQLSVAEWRFAVFSQAGLVGIGAESVAALEAGNVRELEERVRRVREFYGTLVVPGELLDENERGVYERLFGGLRVMERVVEEEVMEEEEEESSGTGVLKETAEGLKEVEFDEDEVVLAREDSLMGQFAAVKTKGDRQLAEDIEAAMASASLRDVPAVEGGEEAKEEAEEDGGSYQRTHPLTLANRFTTSPSTVELPRLPFIDPITAMLGRVSNSQLSDHAHRVFGGPGLPYSTSTPTRGKQMHQKPIAIDAFQNQMSEMEGDIFVSTLMPGMYASVMSILVETRKRLGTEWAEGLVGKAEKGELRILDAGSGGAGVLAVREIIRAEWERMHAASAGDDHSSPLGLAEADGNVGGPGITAPVGHATVLTSSDVLRRRASQLLDNTTFVPRLPDYLHAEVGAVGKFDLVIAAHNLWPLREDHLRKAHVQNLWSLLSTQGGVLALLEKGVPRGFEMIAGARDMLLEHRISSPGSEDRLTSIEEKLPSTGAHFQDVVWHDTEAGQVEAETQPSDGGPDLSTQRKERGMIIAPCTNHTGCPLYTQKGHVKGRRDICSFPQRYHRPAFLQNIFGTKGRNHEDVEFSYLAVMRGHDLRATQSEIDTDRSHGLTPEDPPRIIQSAPITDRAFQGYESVPVPDDSPHSLTLPRAIMPPLKRQGHVIIDLCTPAGTLERWTVPRSFSKQAFRDARKLQWGDLWALGAKTRVPRNIVRARPHPGSTLHHDVDVRLVRQEAKMRRKVALQGVPDVAADDFGRVREGGRVRAEREKGVRDKRDKSGRGNGRRKNLGGGVRDEGL
jgi:ribosomal protein RSM22 (predicted rRNA methylase)